MSTNEWLLCNQRLADVMSDTSSLEPILAKLPSRIDLSDYKLVDIRGIPQNPTFTVSKFENIIDSFQTRDKDVFLSTFVKAGTSIDSSEHRVVRVVLFFSLSLEYVFSESYKQPFC